MPKKFSSFARTDHPAFIPFAALIAAYFVATFLITPDPAVMQKYGLSSMALRLVTLTIALPLAAIWFAAFYGFANLEAYTKTLRGSREADQLHKLSGGLKLLAFSLPLTAVANALLRYYGRLNPEFVETATIISNYITLIFPLISFTFIARGARGLVSTVKRNTSMRHVHTFALVFIVISVMYCALVLYYGDPTMAYHLPVSLLLTTLVMPYLYTWFIGMVAAFDLYVYNTKVKGVLYRRSWSLLSFGIAAIVISSIALQYFSSLTVQINRLSLTALLVLVYILLILISAGYILVAWGSNRLRQIEEA